jgi:hypothetical protein
MPLLDGSAKELIDAYNCGPEGPRYNRVAAKVYAARLSHGDPLSPKFECAILDGLVGFGMARTIKGGCTTLKPRLQRCLDMARKSTVLDQFRDSCLSCADLDASRSAITSVYNCFAQSGTLHPTDQSHVGATKTLHWLFPELFLIVDGNAARAFHAHFSVRLRNTTQPGYSAAKYIECLQKAQKEIQSFGVQQFRQLEPMTPEARIFDKIAFIVGQKLSTK